MQIDFYLLIEQATLNRESEESTEVAKKHAWILSNPANIRYIQNKLVSIRGKRHFLELVFVFFFYWNWLSQCILWCLRILIRCTGKTLIASVFYSQLNLLNDREYEVVTKNDQARLRTRRERHRWKQSQTDKHTATSS